MVALSWRGGWYLELEGGRKSEAARVAPLKEALRAQRCGCAVGFGEGASLEWWEGITRTGCLFWGDHY